ncbi:MAG: hypothetical protein M8352_01360, partial [ANME-2 cluster archaeon]|nr:hypothetical protein [ANME-2 cluster archaeon]
MNLYISILHYNNGVDNNELYNNEEVSVKKGCFYNEGVSSTVPESGFVSCIKIKTGWYPTTRGSEVFHVRV